MIEPPIEGLQSSKKASLPPSNEMKDIILNLKEPAVIHGGLSDWELLKWNLSDWLNAVTDVKLPFRIGNKLCNTSPQWERSCESIELTLEEYLKCSENEGWKNKWAYFDYKYMNQWFEEGSAVLQSVSWKAFGFPDVHGEESTIWLGTEGAHTPCHFDSYSVNIVAQIYGRKLWLMFPPESTNKLKPTRVPYEESSVYSKINFYCGNSDYSTLDEAYFIILEPGDVLVVPNQWWHYVENLSSNAISINTWIPLETDDDKRLEECLVRNFISSTIKDLPTEEQKQILNPNEEVLLNAVGIDDVQLSLCLQRCKTQQMDNIAVKRANFKSVNSTLSDTYKDIQTVHRLPMDEVIHFLRNKCKCNRNERTVINNDKELTTIDLIEDYINAFCHPDVIKETKQKLLLNKK